MAKFRLIPREEKFYDNFISMADQLKIGATLLAEMFAGEKALATKARRNDYGLVNAPSDWLSIQFSSPILPGMNSINTAINAAPDQVRRFILENQPVRGYWVELESAWQALRAHS